MHAKQNWRKTTNTNNELASRQLQFCLINRALDGWSPGEYRANYTMFYLFAQIGNPSRLSSEALHTDLDKPWSPCRASEDKK